MKYEGKLLYFGVCCTKTVRALLLTALLLLAVTFSLSAQKVSAGALFSPKGCGVAVSVPAAGGECTASFAALADFSGLLLGKTKYPGAMARFYYDYTIFSKSDGPAGDAFTLYAGPGAMLGYVRDRDGIFGAAVALSGELGIAYFPVNYVRISLGFNVDLGLHFDSGDKKTRIYMEGLIRTWMPQIGLMYCF